MLRKYGIKHSYKISLKYSIDTRKEEKMILNASKHEITMLIQKKRLFYSKTPKIKMRKWTIKVDKTEFFKHV